METPNDIKPRRVTEASAPRAQRSIEEALSECQRELQVRDRCYARWVSEGKLTSVDARDRMERLQAAVDYLDKAFSLQSATQELP
jgi:hypothetical protein